MFAFIIWCVEEQETTGGCSADRWKGKTGRRRKAGGGRKEEKTGTERRFTLVVGLREDFPYQQGRGSEEI